MFFVSPASTLTDATVVTAVTDTRAPVSGTRGDGETSNSHLRLRSDYFGLI